MNKIYYNVNVYELLSMAFNKIKWLISPQTYNQLHTFSCNKCLPVK